MQKQHPLLLGCHTVGWWVGLWFKCQWPGPCFYSAIIPWSMSRPLRSCLQAVEKIQVCWSQAAPGKILLRARQFSHDLKEEKKFPVVTTSVGFLCFTLAQMELMYSSSNLGFPGRQEPHVCFSQACAGVIFYQSPTSPEWDQKILDLPHISCTVCFLLHDKSDLSIRLSVQCVCRRVFIPKSIRLGVHILHKISIFVLIK